jgi:hypothetical protein
MLPCCSRCWAEDFSQCGNDACACHAPDDPADDDGSVGWSPDMYVPNT